MSKEKTYKGNKNEEQNEANKKERKKTKIRKQGKKRKDQSRANICSWNSTGCCSGAGMLRAWYTGLHIFISVEMSHKLLWNPPSLPYKITVGFLGYEEYSLLKTRVLKSVGDDNKTGNVHVT
jgi:hypothetical protein